VAPARAKAAAAPSRAKAAAPSRAKTAAPSRAKTAAPTRATKAAPSRAKTAAKPKAAATPQLKASAAAATPKAPLPRPTRARKEKLAPALLDRLVAAAVKSLEDDKAENIVVLDVTGRADYADRLIIATGLADRQIEAMATHLDEAFAKEGVKLRGDAVEASPNWVLISAGDLVVHLFKPETRELYALERMWGPHSPAPEDDRTPLPDDGQGGSTAAEDDDE
jgi:ribosome silencing factor RsfS/YbeB/iojap